MEKPGQIVLTSANADYTKAKYFAYLNKQNEAELRQFVDKNRKEIADAQQKAQAAGTPVSQDIINKEIEVKKIEELLNRPATANLADLKEKIQELKKNVDDLG